MIIHTVASGDTIYSISKQYSVPESRIITDNYLNPTKKLFVGQSLIICSPTKTCTVRGGDTLSSIAERHGISIMTLLQNNPGAVMQKPLPSQTLNVEYDKKGLKNIVVSADSGGATVKEIEKWMPYISILNIQNGATLENGELTVLKVAEPLIELSKKYKALPILAFECIDEIIVSDTATEKFVDSAIRVVKESGLAGLEMWVSPDKKPYKYWGTLLTLGVRLKENGYFFSLPFVPYITSSNQTELSNIADLISIKNCSLSDKNTVSAAAPFDRITEVLSSLSLSQLLEKSLLTIPTFGVMYSPIANGYKKTVVDASFGEKIASFYQINAKFDNASATPFIVYNERIHGSEPMKTLLFDDANSYSQKFDLIDKFGLSGVNITSLEFSSPVLWQVLNQKFNIIKY